MWKALDSVLLRAVTAVLVALVLGISPVAAQRDSEELAKKLANPVAALISVPMQLNFDRDIGPADNGERWTLDIQPVVPVELNEDWIVISREILPGVSQDEIFPGAGSQTGVGDVVQSATFSLKAATRGGWIWGAGPVFPLPSGSDGLLTVGKWAAGPTMVVLKQRGPWTFGALGNHLWSFAGDSERSEVNLPFIQPFLSYTTPTAWTDSFNTESSSPEGKGKT